MKRRFINHVAFCLLSIGCVFLTACIQADRSISDRHNSTSSSMRTVEHALGLLQVPAQPQRLVTPSPCTMEASLALNIEPIGGSHWNWNQPYLEGKVENIQDVGWIPEINLEVVATLDPDLILATVYQRSIYDLLSRIAPTYLAEEYSQGSGDWKEIFTQVADALDQTKRAEQVMADYNARLAELRTHMGSRTQELEVSVVAVYRQNINVYLEDDFSGTILKDAGLSRPIGQRRDRKTLSSGSTSISRERLQDLDADILFLVINGSDSQTKETVQQLQIDPLWAQLKFIQNGKVFHVSDYWLGCSPLAANAVIDDLFKYLLEEEE